MHEKFYDLKINYRSINLKGNAFLKIYLLFFFSLPLGYFLSFFFSYHIVKLITNVYWTRLLILSFECDCIRQWKIYLDSIREEQKDFPFYISRTYKHTFFWWIFNEPSLHNPSSFECKSLDWNSREGETEIWCSTFKNLRNNWTYSLIRKVES